MATAYQKKPNLAHSVIDQFLILVHPCCYDALNTPLTDPYMVFEVATRQRWLYAIPSLPRSTFVVQVDYSQNPSANEVHQAFIDRLDAGHVTRIPVRVVGPSTPGPLKEYYEDINQQILQQMATEGLTFDPATAKADIWGESFEGCAPRFGSAIASYLGLKTPTTLDYNMGVPDAPHLLNATFLQTVPVPASDVEAYIFDLNDGRLAALFRSTLTPQGLDYRPIELQLDPAIFSVLTKQGDTVWPQDPPPMRAQEVTFFTVHAQFLIAPKLNLSELLAAMKEAKVGSQTADSNSKGSG